MTAEQRGPAAATGGGGGGGREGGTVADLRLAYCAIGEGRSGGSGRKHTVNRERLQESYGRQLPGS